MKYAIVTYPIYFSDSCIHAYSTKTQVKFTFVGVSPAAHFHLPEIWLVICFFTISLCNEAPMLCHHTTSKEH